MVMNKQLQAERHSSVNRFAENNKEKLLEWGKKKGIVPETDRDIPFVLAEIVGRILALKAIKIISGYTYDSIKQMPLGCNYDMLTPNNKHIEVKFKYNDDDEYVTDDISLHKKELNEGLEYDGGTEVIIPFFNGVVRCFDMMLPFRDDLEWTRDSTTAVKGVEKTEPKLSYNPKDALWTTNITMPDWDVILQ